MSNPLSSSTACVTVAPGKDGYLPSYACGALLDYVPSFCAALAFAILFLVTTVIHITQGIKYKKVLFSTPAVVNWYSQHNPLSMLITHHSSSHTLGL